MFVSNSSRKNSELFWAFCKNDLKVGTYHKAYTYLKMFKAWFRYVSLKVHFIFRKNQEALKFCLKNNHACIKVLLKKSIKGFK